MKRRARIGWPASGIEVAQGCTGFDVDSRARIGVMAKKLNMAMAYVQVTVVPSRAIV
jgi:hypothetical protein